jgi:hypothetical protein
MVLVSQWSDRIGGVEGAIERDDLVLLRETLTATKLISKLLQASQQEDSEDDLQHIQRVPRHGTQHIREQEEICDHQERRMEGGGLTLDRGEDGVDTDPSDDAKGPEDVILDEADGHKELVPDLNRQRVKLRVPVKAPPLESGLEASQGLAMDLREGGRMEGGRR